MIRTAVVALGLLFSQVAHAATVDADVTIGNAVEGFVRPGYAALHKATQELGASLDNLCANPATSSLSQARDAFSRTVDAWSEIEIIRFGPVTKENRLERILFWPDRKRYRLEAGSSRTSGQGYFDHRRREAERKKCRRSRPGGVGVFALRDGG